MKICKVFKKFGFFPGKVETVLGPFPDSVLLQTSLPLKLRL